MNQPRNSEYPIESFILERWSPRSLVPEEIPEQDLMSLFEAARWAPSSSNNQPWRFLYAKRSSSFWPLFLNLLVPINQAWAGDAAVLVVLISNTKFDRSGTPSITHSFDTGAAWENLALQAHIKGYVAHGMQGFDYEKARVDLAIPEDFAIEAMIAIGKQGPRERLPASLQEREMQNSRRPLSESIAEGPFVSSLLHSKKE